MLSAPPPVACESPRPREIERERVLFQVGRPRFGEQAGNRNRALAHGVEDAGPTPP